MIAVVTTIADENIGDSMRTVKERYCGLFGYDFIVSSTQYYKGRHTAWQKIALIQELLPKYDWVVYLAADVGFANFAYGVEKVINEQSKDHDIIVARDGATSVNTDVLFCRNSRATMEFLQTWGAEETYKKWPGGEKHDQWAFYQLFSGRFRKVAGAVSPMRTINALAKGTNDFFRKQYHAGDFIENCTLCSEKERVAAVEKIWKLNEGYIGGGKPVMRVELKAEYCREKFVSRVIPSAVSSSSNAAKDESSVAIRRQDGAKSRESKTIHSIPNFQKNNVVKEKNGSQPRKEEENPGFSSRAREKINFSRWKFDFPL